MEAAELDLNSVTGDQDITMEVGQGPSDQPTEIDVTHSPASGSEHEDILSDNSGESILDCSLIDLSHDPDQEIFQDIEKIRSLYNIKQFTSTSSKNSKLSKAPFEVIDPNLHSKKAYYNGFRTTACRLPYWFQAIFFRVYVDIGNQPELTMNWNDEGSPIHIQIRVEELNAMVDKNSNLKERHLYTVWIYLTMGGIAFQGPNYQDVIDNMFPVLKRIVTDKVGLVSDDVQHE